MQPLSPVLKYIICIGGTVAVGSLSGLATANSIDTWYSTLQKPSFNPPNWIFGPVWTFLYVLMGIAAGLVWNSDHAPSVIRKALSIYAAQLTLNTAWSILFFTLRSPTMALVDIIALWIVIAACIRAFNPLRGTAAMLLYPYLAWVSFATILNLSLVVLN